MYDDFSMSIETLYKALRTDFKDRCFCQLQQPNGRHHLNQCESLFINILSLHLQWTMIGPSESGRPFLTKFRKCKRFSTLSGTPRSGQLVKWNWVTSLTSLSFLSPSKCTLLFYILYFRRFMIIFQFSKVFHYG